MTTMMNMKMEKLSCENTYLTYIYLNKEAKY